MREFGYFCCVRPCYKISILTVAATLVAIVMSCATNMSILTAYYANKQISREGGVVDLLQLPYEIIS